MKLSRKGAALARFNVVSLSLWELGYTQYVAYTRDRVGSRPTIEWIKRLTCEMESFLSRISR